MEKTNRRIVIEDIPEELYFEFVALKATKQCNTWIELMAKLVQESRDRGDQGGA